MDIPTNRIRIALAAHHPYLAKWSDRAVEHAWERLLPQQQHDLLHRTRYLTGDNNADQPIAK